MKNTIYQDKLVTIDPEFVQIGATQYDLDGIVSFTGQYRTKSTCLARTICIGLFVMAFLVIVSFSIKYYTNLQLNDFNFAASLDVEATKMIYGHAVSLIVYLIPAVLILLWIRSRKNTYAIQFQTSAGTVEAVSSHNEKYIDQLLTALSEAKRQSKNLRR